MPEPMTCRRCGAPLSGEVSAGADRLYCSRCLVEEAERHIETARTPKRRLRIFRESRTWRFLLWAVSLAALAVIGMQAPALRAVFDDPKPVRNGPYATDAPTDECLRNLWRGASLLQQGKESERARVCPGSGKPYIIRPERDDTVIRCPDPARHGFREIRASVKNPVPELVR